MSLVNSICYVQEKGKGYSLSTIINYTFNYGVYGSIVCYCLTTSKTKLRCIFIHSNKILDCLYVLSLCEYIFCLYSRVKHQRSQIKLYLKFCITIGNVRGRVLLRLLREDGVHMKRLSLFYTYIDKVTGYFKL